MFVIKRGNNIPEKPRELFYIFTCYKCKCEFVVSESELLTKRKPATVLAINYPCPMDSCNSYAYEYVKISEKQARELQQEHDR